MSTVNGATSLVTGQASTTLTDTLVMASAALHAKAAQGQINPSEHSNMAASLYQAVTTKKLKQGASKHQRTGGKGPRAWYALQERGCGAEFTKDLAAMSAWLNLSAGSVRVYLTRHKGVWNFDKTVNDVETTFTLRYATTTEAAEMASAPFDLWSPPATAAPNRKKLAGRGKLARPLHNATDVPKPENGDTE